MMRTRRGCTLTLVLLAAVMASTGCGYALAGRGSSLPAYIRTIAVPPFENRTKEFEVEKTFTDKVRVELINRGRYKVDQTVGEAILRGVVVSMSTQPAGVNEQQRGSRYLVTVVLSVSVIETKTNEVLWSNDALTFRDEYDFSTRGGAQGTLLVNDRTVLERMSADVARTVVTAIMEAF